MSKEIDEYKKKAEQGDAEAQCSLGDCYRLGQGVEQDYSEAFKWYQLSAEQGDSDAQFCLGVMYQNGIEIDRSLELAVDWYRKSAEQGNADAQCCLGACYCLGDGVEQDDFMAFRWYQLSAEREILSLNVLWGIVIVWVMVWNRIIPRPSNGISYQLNKEIRMLNFV
ncbi:tetratricopeptide repeat protein [Bacteroides finegoldii]|uniref:tetratricopeptide repeat protein n=1 Tax=Bacteroides finegoldii TaxID=338188 RepID=UPI002666B677|nr:tetratricopeptide repeat protein [Bacteroides finegoldii]